jgi:LysR family hydrogen peroxide-inducible transcriptional activator
MDLHQLDCFLAVLHEGSFAGAAARMHKTQPAISYQIRKLEEDLGLTLILRGTGPPPSPTQAGRVLERHAERLLARVYQARRAVARVSDGAAGEARLGTINSVGIYFLPEVLWALKRRYPSLSLRASCRSTQENLAAVRAGELELAIVANPDSDDRLCQELLFEEPISLVCGPSHPLYGRSTIRADELAEQRFVSLAAEHPTGELVEHLLADIGVQVDPVVTVSNVQAVKKVVQLGLGVAFLPDMVTAHDIAGGIQPSGRLARIDVGVTMTRKIVLVYRKADATAPMLVHLRAELRRRGERWRREIRGAEPRPPAASPQATRTLAPTCPWSSRRSC